MPDHTTPPLSQSPGQRRPSRSCLASSRASGRRGACVKRGTMRDACGGHALPLGRAAERARRWTAMHLAMRKQQAHMARAHRRPGQPPDPPAELTGAQRRGSDMADRLVAATSRRRCRQGRQAGAAGLAGGRDQAADHAPDLARAAARPMAAPPQDLISPSAPRFRRVRHAPMDGVRRLASGLHANRSPLLLALAYS
jgi:hypothetical protein